MRPGPRTIIIIIIITGMTAITIITMNMATTMVIITTDADPIDDACTRC